MANKELRYTVYDIECMVNISTYCFKDYQTKKKKEFVIHHSRNDFDALYKFLLQIAKGRYYLIGFNNLAYDSQLIEFILGAYEHLKHLPADRICTFLYNKSQEILSIPESERFKVLIPEKQLSIMQIDVYKQKHYDGKAKRTSLKWLEFTMNFPNIQEMPIPHDVSVTTEQVKDVLEYNWNDVEATFEFFERIKFETDLRLQLSETFKLPLLNASEPRMAREILASLLAQDMNISVRDLKEKRTFRKEIHLGKCIIPIVKFKSDEFNDILSRFKRTTINALNTKDCFKYMVQYRGLDIYYGVGGVHGAVAPGIYSSDEEYVIKTVDVSSFYPNMIINYGFAPAHLGITFAKRYKWFYDERKKYGKKDPINYIYKIILNSTYGLSNDKNSFIYDTLTTMKTTVNGQLLLSMLAEYLCQIENSTLLMMNTDGLEIRIPRRLEAEFQRLCKEWEEATNLVLEYEEYDKMIISDVNNYIAIFSPRKAKSEEDYNKLKIDEPYYIFPQHTSTSIADLTYQPVKLKGRFEVKLDYHKNPSGLVIPKSVYNYFAHGIKPEDSIAVTNNIFDFCYGIKKKSDFNIVLHSIVNGKHVKEHQQKVVRFYVSKEGGKLVKEYHDGRNVSVNASALVKPYNIVYNPDIIPDDLNRKYYIDECYSEIHNIEGYKNNQLSLF